METRSASPIKAAGVLLGLALAIFPTAARQARPQNPPSRPSQADAGQDKKIGVLTVRLPISVKDKRKNRFVPGLVQNNFEVYEDGKRQKIIGFEAPSRLPLQVGILMDTSNSVKLKLPFEKEAAEEFVATVLAPRRKGDRVLFATFDSQVVLHQDFTDNEELLIRAIRQVKANGHTRLYDAVYRVVEEKMSSPEDSSEARRILVVLSDGEDTGSERALRETIEMGQRYDVTVFGISTKNFTGITSGMVANEDDKLLRRLCEDTGGQLFLPSQKIDLFRSFTSVAHDIRAEYVLLYDPVNQQRTGKPRDITVKLVAADGRLFHKSGYTY
jgi:Ca-activated chloride channel family protein